MSFALQPRSVEVRLSADLDIHKPTLNGRPMEAPARDGPREVSSVWHSPGPLRGPSQSLLGINGLFKIGVTFTRAA